MSRRRGDTLSSAVIALALMAIVGVVILIIALSIRKGSEKEEWDAKCAASVLAHANAAKATGGKALPAIQCPTKRVVVDTTSEDEAKQALAQEMKRCWAIWGKGQLDLFGKNEGTYCHVCAVVTTKGVSQVHDFPGYLDSAKATDKLTYGQYLAGQTSGPVFNGTTFKNRAESVLATDQPVAVIFYNAKGLTSFQRLQNGLVGHTGASTAVGGLVGVGLAMASTGVLSIPGAILIVGGAGAGLVTSFVGTADTSYIQYVVVRPVTEQGISSLGCQYDPVSN